MGWLLISGALITIGAILWFKESIGLSTLFLGIGICALVICSVFSIAVYATHETKYLDTVEYRQLMDDGSDFGAYLFNRDLRIDKIQSKNPIWGSMFYGNLQDIEEIPLK